MATAQLRRLKEATDMVSTQYRELYYENMAVFEIHLFVMNNTGFRIFNITAGTGKYQLMRWYHISFGENGQPEFNCKYYFYQYALIINAGLKENTRDKKNNNLNSPQIHINVNFPEVTKI